MAVPASSSALPGTRSRNSYFFSMRLAPDGTEVRPGLPVAIVADDALVDRRQAIDRLGGIVRRGDDQAGDMVEMGMRDQIGLSPVRPARGRRARRANSRNLDMVERPLLVRHKQAIDERARVAGDGAAVAGGRDQERREIAVLDAAAGSERHHLEAGSGDRGSGRRERRGENDERARTSWGSSSSAGQCGSSGGGRRRRARHRADGTRTLPAVLSVSGRLILALQIGDRPRSEWYDRLGTGDHVAKNGVRG